MKRRMTWRLWQPPGETLEAIAEVLGSHWHAAKAQERLFWPAAATWLQQQARQLTGEDMLGSRYLASLARCPAVTTSAHHLTSGGRLIR